MATADPEAWRDFGGQLKAARDERNLPRAAVAKAAGLSTATLANFERGGRTHRGEWQVPSPEARTLRKLAEALGLPSDALLDAPSFPDISPGPTLRPIPGEGVDLEDRLAWLEIGVQAIARAVGATLPPPPGPASEAGEAAQ